MPLQIRPLAAKRDALHLEPQSLFGSGFERQLDFAASAQHAVPGKAARRFGVKKMSNGAMKSRVASGFRHLPIGGDFTFGNRKNHPPEGSIAFARPE